MRVLTSLEFKYDSDGRTATVGDEEYHRRTLITRLALSPHDERLLRETTNAWLEACNLASELAWDDVTAARDVQSLAYDHIREKTTLGSQHVILATHSAARAIRSGIERQKSGLKTSQPEFTTPSMSFDSRTMTIFPEKEQVSLTTCGDHDRIRADLVLSENDDGYQQQFLRSAEWQPTESTVHYRDGNWFLHIGVRKPRDERPEIENGTVLGVDLGVEQIAVTSTAKFFSAGELNHRRREFERTRSQLQARGSRSAHRTLERVCGRETKYVKHVLHGVANGIIEEANEHDCDGIIFESLTGIRERIPEATWHSKWAFETLFRFIEYKAAAAGMFVETVDPHYTSQRCPECGDTREANRRSRSWFACHSCGCCGHADYVASKNVASKYLRRDQQASRRRGVSQYALKSGTVSLTDLSDTPTDESVPP